MQIGQIDKRLCSDRMNFVETYKEDAKKEKN